MWIATEKRTVWEEKNSTQNFHAKAQSLTQECQSFLVKQMPQVLMQTLVQHSYYRQWISMSHSAYKHILAVLPSSVVPISYTVVPVMNCFVKMLEKSP